MQQTLAGKCTKTLVAFAANFARRLSLLAMARNLPQEQATKPTAQNHGRKGRASERQRAPTSGACPCAQNWRKGLFRNRDPMTSMTSMSPQDPLRPLKSRPRSLQAPCLTIHPTPGRPICRLLGRGGGRGCATPSSSSHACGAGCNAANIRRAMGQ